MDATRERSPYGLRHGCARPGSASGGARSPESERVYLIVCRSHPGQECAIHARAVTPAGVTPEEPERTGGSGAESGTTGCSPNASAARTGLQRAPRFVRRRRPRTPATCRPHRLQCRCRNRLRHPAPRHSRNRSRGQGRGKSAAAARRWRPRPARPLHRHRDDRPNAAGTRARRSSRPAPPAGTGRQATPPPAAGGVSPIRSRGRVEAGCYLGASWIRRMAPS